MDRILLSRITIILTALVLLWVWGQGSPSAAHQSDLQISL